MMVGNWSYLYIFHRWCNFVSLINSFIHRFVASCWYHTVISSSIRGFFSSCWRGVSTPWFSAISNRVFLVYGRGRVPCSHCSDDVFLNMYTSRAVYVLLLLRDDVYYNSFWRNRILYVTAWRTDAARLWLCTTAQVLQRGVFLAIDWIYAKLDHSKNPALVSG